MDIKDFFTENKKAALAFSGGVDSSYLLYAARQYGAELKAYYVHSEFQPEFEFEDAKRLAAELGADMKVIELSVLSDEEVRKNGPDRCYHCKKRIFSAILSEAVKDGYELLLDGTNASDDAGDRPGMRALKELSVRSPLRECGLTKEDIRRLSREAGLFTWNKPAYACLATRVPTGEAIDKEKLLKTEKAEALLGSLGFSDFRIRLFEGCARIQLKESQFPLLMEKHSLIREELGRYYKAVFLDLEARDEQ